MLCSVKAMRAIRQDNSDCARGPYARTTDSWDWRSPARESGFIGSY